MENNLSGLALVKELNDNKRTQGVVEAVEFNSPHKDICIKLSEYKNTNGEWQFADRVCENFKDLETAKYTALAVNHFASVVDALSIMTFLCKIKYGNLDKDVYNEILKAEQALNNIK